ncbi:Mbeg1-like protein [Streptococcus rifensis]
MDFLDYGKKVGETSLTELPLTVIDIAILTELSYMVFKDFLTASCNPKKGMTLRELVHHYNRLGVTDSQRELKLSYDKRTELFDLLAHAPRYRDIIAFAHQDIYDEDKEIQFAATSFTILNQILVIYRGTDSSIIGWKEDFNLSYMTIPSQELALDYLKQLCSYHHDNLILAGHSKGGNLALYAASHLSNADSITAIYTFDSPGLSEAQIKRSDYQKIQDKIIAFRPSASIVGVLFDQQVEVTLVKSHGIGLLQHLMFLWEVDSETNSFKIASKSTPNSRNIQKLTADFLKESREEDNRNIVNLLYQALFSRTEVTTVAHRIRLFFSILFHASKREKDALFQVGTHFFTRFNKTVV